MLTLNQVNLISTGTEERHLKLQDCVFFKIIIIIIVIVWYKKPRAETNRFWIAQNTKTSPAAESSRASLFMLSQAGQIYMLSATFEFEISSDFSLLNSSLQPPLLPPGGSHTACDIATWQQVTDKSQSASYFIWGLPPNVLHSPTCHCAVTSCKDSGLARIPDECFFIFCL